MVSIYGAPVDVYSLQGYLYRYTSCEYIFMELCLLCIYIYTVVLSCTQLQDHQDRHGPTRPWRKHITEKAELMMHAYMNVCRYVKYACHVLLKLPVWAQCQIRVYFPFFFFHLSFLFVSTSGGSKAAALGIHHALGISDLLALRDLPMPHPLARGLNVHRRQSL